MSNTPTKTMELKHIILYLCVCTTASCFPSVPLSDRPSELAWQAWLLVGSQNPSETERRITPKSIFIVPKAHQNNDSQPDCENGYRLDSMGKCIQFVKVDEDAQMNFLLWRLNSMYGTKSSEKGEDDNKSGPLQLNIPLNGDVTTNKEAEYPEEIAIIVAPTNGNFDELDSKIKRRNEETTLTPGQEEDEDDDDDDVVDDSTSVEEVEDDTTAVADVTTTEEPETTTTTTFETSTQQALFFLIPINHTEHVSNNRTVDTGSTSETTTDNIGIDNSTPIDTEPPAVKGKFDPVIEPILTDKASFVRFPIHRDSTTFRFPTDANPPYDDKTPSNLDHVLDFKPEHHRLSNSEIKELFRRYIQQNPEVVALSSTEGSVNRRRPVSESTYIDGDTVQPQYHNSYPTYSHRNRDRNSQFWRPSNYEDSLQKPLVLRFGRQDGVHLRFNPSNEGVRYYEERQKQYPSEGFGRVRRRGHLR